MKSVTESVLIRLLDPDKIEEDDSYVLLVAGEALAKHAMTDYSTGGVCPEVDATEISANDCKQIINALLEAYTAYDSLEMKSRILTTLGKARDPALVDFFRQQLAELTKLLLRANSSVYQAMIGLNDLDEAILEGGGSIMDVDANLTEARRYLQQFGTVLPW